MKRPEDRLEQLKSDYSLGRVNRRTFMEGAVALGATILGASTMMKEADAATPKKGGTLRLAFSSGSSTDTLDPMISEGATFMVNVGYCLYNNLVEVNADGGLDPELCESYDSSDDAAVWTFNLRKGVEWHDGKSFTADDVIYSMNRHRGETESAMKSLMAPVKDIRKDGDHKVIFELEAGNADFPFIVSDYHLPILAAHAEPTSGLGTGGYALSNWEPGVRASFKKHANYFKSDRAHFDEVEAIVAVDAAARQNALRSNEVDAIDNVDPKTVHLLGKVPGINVLEVTGTEQRLMLMRLDTPPFDNVDVRLAIKYAAKRQEMIDKIVGGRGTLGNDHHISPSQQYHNSELPQREFDADKARYHWKKAGMEGQTIELNASEASLEGSVNASELLQASAAEAGINIQVNRKPTDGYWNSVWNQKGIGFVTSYWGGRPTNDWMYSTCCVDGSEWNDSAWRGTPAADRFNELVVAARTEVDTDKRREMYWECQKLLNEDGGSMVWTFSNILMGLRDHVRTPAKVAANWQMDGSKCAERWWFA